MEMDTASKRLFGLRRMAARLLCAVAPELAPHLDFTDMVSLSANWARPEDSDDTLGAQRYADTVWRIGYADDSARSLLLLLEFQSKPDPKMAWRVRDYLNLLQDGLRTGDQLDADGNTRSLAVVVHSGRSRWSAGGGVDAVPVSADGTPQMAFDRPYLLLDLRRMQVDDATMLNPATAVLGIATTTSLDEAKAWVGEMAVRLPEAVADPEAWRELKGPVREWLSAMLSQLFPGVAAEEIEGIARGLFEEEEREGSMFIIDEKIEEWKEREQRLGEVRGIAKGRAEGIERERSRLREQAEHKFGAAVGEELARRLEPVSDTSKLREASVLIIDCADGAELLARVRPNGSG